MTEAGLGELSSQIFTASARAGSPALVVVAEETIPDAYWLPQQPKLDRQAILGELKRGLEIRGRKSATPSRCLA